MFIIISLISVCGIFGAFVGMGWYAVRVHDRVMTQTALVKTDLLIGIAGVLALWSSVLLFLAGVALRCSGVID